MNREADSASALWDPRAQFEGQGVPRNHGNRPLGGKVETWASRGFLPALWVTMEKSPRPQSSYLEGHHQLLQLGIPLLRRQEHWNKMQTVFLLTEGPWGNPLAYLLTCVWAVNYALI